MYTISRMVSSGVSSAWLGTRHDGDFWIWLDQSRWDYTNWNNGQPNLDLRCAILSSSGGLWSTSDCFVTAGYLCKAQPSSKGVPKNFILYSAEQSLSLKVTTVSTTIK